jgi:predicted RNA-binding protein with RPS1 domain
MDGSKFRPHESDVVEGDVYEGTVARLESFGAFITLNGLRERGPQLRVFCSVHDILILGLVHISQLASDRVNSAGDVVELDQKVFVKVLSVETNESGGRKISLSMKLCSQVPYFI